MTHFRSATLTALWLCALAARAQSPTAVVRKLYDAYARGDMPRIMAMLDATETLELSRREMLGEALARCVAIESLSITPLVQSDTSATVRAVAHILLTPRVHGRAWERVEVRTFTLDRRKDEWRITAMPSEEDALLAQFDAARDDEAVRKLLAAHEQLLTPYLVRKMAGWAVILGNRHGSGAPDAHTIAIEQRVAETLGDRIGAAIAAAQMVQSERETRDAEARQALAPRLDASIATLEREGAEPNEMKYALWYRGGLYMDKDESSREGEELFKRITDESDSIEARGVSAAWAQIGVTRFIRQDFGGSYAAFSRELAEDERRGDPVNGFALMYIGRIFERQNDPQLALTYFLRALKLPDILTTHALVLLGTARTYRALGNLAKADDYVQQTLTLTRPTRYKGLIAQALAIEAEILVQRGELRAAEGALREAITDARIVAYDQGETEALVALGKIDMKTRRFDDALRVSGELAAIAARHDFGGFERYASLVLAGRAQRARGDVAAAKESFEAAVEYVDAMRGAIAGAERERRLFFEPYSAAYDELVDLLVRERHAADALIYAERSKGRTLLDVLHGGRRDQETLSDADRARRAALVRALGEKNRQLLAAQTAAQSDAAAIELRTHDVRAAQLALDQFETELAARDPRLRVQLGAAPIVALHDLPKLLPDARVAFVEFVTHEEGTDVFVVDRDGARARVTHRRIPIARAALERRAGRFADAVAAGAFAYKAEGRALYDMLLAPVEARLRSKEVIAIIPDGVLWRVPFAALVTRDGRFLVERSACFFAPSISVYREMAQHRREAGSTALLAVGNPALGDSAGSQFRGIYRNVSLGSLPEAESEVRQIAMLYGASRSRLFTGAGADESRVKNAMPESRVIHFAAHGVLDDRNPMYSEIVLAQRPESDDDGVLQAWEMMRLDLHADLVVLSACSTARGAIGAGEGLIGMTWALFAAGCPSTVATLWNIDSPSAAELMVDFHRRLTATSPRTRFAKAEALRAAQLRMIRRGRRNPFYWSAFELIGR
jgi:CHAT domain-containing protein